VLDRNAADLRVLEVKVVTNVTAFYTYFKAMRDTHENHDQARRSIDRRQPP
jgi:hypothetical protein